MSPDLAYKPLTPEGRLDRRYEVIWGRVRGVDHSVWIARFRGQNFDWASTARAAWLACKEHQKDHDGHQ